MYKANLSGSVHATNLVATCRHKVACIARPFEAPSAQRCDSDRERFPIAAVSMSFPIGACLVIGKLEIASHPVAVAAFTFVVNDMKSKATSKPKGSEHPIILEHPFTRNFLLVVTRPTVRTTIFAVRTVVTRPTVRATLFCTKRDGRNP